tara:strand:+ start:8272 stop:11658 length:3387 start_codon:yes stop_codon:yes gene_type:complete
MTLYFNAATGSATATGDVFTEVSGNLRFTKPDVRAVYIDWGDGEDPDGNFSHDRRYANYQWVKLDEPKQNIITTHTYTATGTFNPVVQTVNSNGFFSRYTGAGADPGSYVLQPYSQNAFSTSNFAANSNQGGIQPITVSDTEATAVIKSQNRTVFSGIDNSILEKEGPKLLYMVIPPLCSAAELVTVASATLQVKCVMDFSMIETGTQATEVGGGGRRIVTLEKTLAGAALSGASGITLLDTLDDGTTGTGLVSQVLEVKYLDPKTTTNLNDYSDNDIYNRFKMFVVVTGDDGFEYPLSYVTAGSPIKKANDPLRNTILDFGQSRAAASNVDISKYRYDVGKVWFQPANQWDITGTLHLGNATAQTNTTKSTGYTYSNVQPNGLNGVNTAAYLAFSDSSSARAAYDYGSLTQKFRTDQFIIDDFGRFLPQNHLTRVQVQPSSSTSITSSQTSSMAVRPLPYRITPTVLSTMSMATSGAATKIDIAPLASGNFSRAYVSEAFNQRTSSATNLVSLSGVNTQTFDDMSGDARTDNEYMILLFSEKTNMIGFNINNYAQTLINKTLSGSAVTPAETYKIGVSYLHIDNPDTRKQNAYWKDLEFEDTTRVGLELRNTTSGSYDYQYTSLGQSGYIKYDMPQDWKATNLNKLVGGQYLVDYSDATNEMSYTNTVTTVVGSTTITHAATYAPATGYQVSGSGIPSGATIESITDSTHFIITEAATAAASVTCTFRYPGTDDIIVTGSTITDVGAAASSTFGGVMKVTGLTGEDVTGGAIDLAGLGTADECGAFRYIALCNSSDNASASTRAKIEKRPMWVASGTSNGLNAARNELYLTYGDTSTSGGNIYDPVAGGVGDTCVFVIRRINIYDVFNGVSKVQQADGASAQKLAPVDAQATAFPNSYVFVDTSPSTTTIGGAMTAAWSGSSNLKYAVKLSIQGSGSADGGGSSIKAFPGIYNILGMNNSYSMNVQEVDDSAWNLNALPITSDISSTQAGNYYQAITRKGKVFIAKTGIEITNISFASVALGNTEASDAFDERGPGTNYGWLHKLRQVQAESIRVYWDEPQKDGTFVRFWGIVTTLNESHPAGSPQSIVNYSFDLTVDSIALIDENSRLMTDIFPLGGSEINDRNYT